MFFVRATQVHILVGGQWGNEQEDFIGTTGYNIAAVQLTKYMWRKGYLRVPNNCLPGDECIASCPSEIYESRGMSVYDVLMDVNALPWIASVTRGKLVRIFVFLGLDFKFYINIYIKNGSSVKRSRLIGDWEI